MAAYVGMRVNYYAPEDVRIEPLMEIPQISDGEVLIKIEACALTMSQSHRIWRAAQRMRFKFSQKACGGNGKVLER
jgi:threonine dehydrogenase-like Zn-dependent dehydrogenase